MPIKECLGSGIRYLEYGVVMFLVCKGVELLLPLGEIWSLIVIIGVGMLVYFGELIVTKDPMVKMGIKMLKDYKTKT